MTAKQENSILRKICADLHPMARRYANGRMTYATSMFNEHVRTLLSLGIKLNPTADGIIWATDGNGRRFDGLTHAQATPGTPEAKGEKP